MSGKLVWKKHLGAEYGAFQINWGHGSSPAVHDGVLLLLSYHERTSYLLALDARTGAEMIALFERLNADGTTIIVVTHDEELARAAKRTIHMRDGVIVGDDRVRPIREG